MKDPIVSDDFQIGPDGAYEYEDSYSMLIFPKIDNRYEVRVESNNKLLGELILNIDGFYYFSILDTPVNGLWSDYALSEIVNKLKELNHDWKEHVDKYFNDLYEEWDVTLMDGLEDEDDIYI
jgi:hypothetical protein